MHVGFVHLYVYRRCIYKKNKSKNLEEFNFYMEIISESIKYLVLRSKRNDSIW